MILISILDKVNDIKNILGENEILVAVTKTRSDQEVDELLLFGISDIAENKVQAFLDRYEKFSDKARFHFIGRLQTNKVKYLVNKVYLIHSLDRESLLYELEKQGKKNNFIFSCLIQLNISKEDSKTGIYLEDLSDFAEKVSKCNYVHIKGFMTMAPMDCEIEKLHYIFRRAKKTFDIYKKMGYNNFDVNYLSMGMSQDFKIALEEGSNMIRIGTKLFE